MILHRSHADRRRAGYVAVLIALSMVAIVSMLALSLDGGVLMSDYRYAQSTADSAAMAAAGQLYYYYWSNNGSDTNGAGSAAALAVAAQNGYANNANGGTKVNTSSVTVNIPPSSGLYAGKAGYAEVIVTYYEPRGFSRIFDTGSVPVQARAVAIGSPIAAQVGILLLDPSSKDAFNAGGGGSLTIIDTPVVVNSTNAEGSIANGGTTITAPEFDLQGGYATAGGGSFNGTINTGRPPMPDPLAYLPVPDPSTMTKQSNKKTQMTNGSTTLSPGVYKGGINASGTANLTLNPGIYYMDGGGFGFSGQGNLTGSGVMIYNAPGNGNSDKVSITGSGVVNLSPMTSGVYQGMTLFQDRTSNVSASVTGGAGSSLSGTFYFASALLNVSGNGTSTMMGSQYISYDLNVTGSGTTTIQWTPNTVARRRMIALVE